MVHIAFPYVVPENVAPALIEKEIPILRWRSVPPMPPEIHELSAPLDLGGRGGRYQQTRFIPERVESTGQSVDQRNESQTSSARNAPANGAQRALEFEQAVDEHIRTETADNEDSQDSKITYGL